MGRARAGTIDGMTPVPACCDKTTCRKALDAVRYVSSTIITLGCIATICYAIGNNHAALPGHPAVHFALFVFVLILLAYLEGLQVAILALERVDGAAFKASHPRAFVVHRLSTARAGLNVQRFLVGRQFFVVFVVFLCQWWTYRIDSTRPNEYGFAADYGGVQATTESSSGEED